MLAQRPLGTLQRQHRDIRKIHGGRIYKEVIKTNHMWYLLSKVKKIKKLVPECIFGIFNFNLFNTNAQAQHNYTPNNRKTQTRLGNCQCRLNTAV